MGWICWRELKHKVIEVASRAKWMTLSTGNEENGEPVSSIVVSDCEEIEESQVEELLKKETKRRIYEEH